jgi:hypothetical protein
VAVHTSNFPERAVAEAVAEAPQRGARRPRRERRKMCRNSTLHSILTRTWNRKPYLSPFPPLPLIESCHGTIEDGDAPEMPSLLMFSNSFP